MTDSHPSPERTRLQQAINLRLTALGFASMGSPAGMTAAPLRAKQEEARLQSAHLCPVDARIQAYLDRALANTAPIPRLPAQTFVLDEPDLARELSLPIAGDYFASPLLKSYRLRNGVLHNPANDRRTTQGVFHIAEGGLPIPDDKLAVPAATFARLLERALQPPTELLNLPFTAGNADETACFVSLLLRPLVVPAVPGFIGEKRMELRFFAPGSLVSNLDFVESIFGNAGDPRLPEHDAALNPAGWTGHTGCVILAPHLTAATKHELGLPDYDHATARQRRDGMCWRKPDELYNGGSTFKICSRDAGGVIVTIIADNYYGYCKKEVKTQISYSANLFGLAEEEHAGGALVYPAYDLGEEFSGNLHVQQRGHCFTEVAERYQTLMEVKPEGYGIDREYPSIIYVPEDVAFDLNKQQLSWTQAGKVQSLPFRAGHTYVRPSGYKVHLEQPPAHTAWHIVGTVAEGTLCHKPCTVSGGGKSEISKAISDAILPGPIFVADFDRDMDRVEGIGRIATVRIDFAFPTRLRHRLAVHPQPGALARLGHQIADARRQGILQGLQHLAALDPAVPEGNRFRRETALSFDVGQQVARSLLGRYHINGNPGNELKCDNRKLTASYLRVGFDVDGAWRVFGLARGFPSGGQSPDGG